jgi:hypothetical protein
MSSAAAVRVLADILANYLPTELATRLAAEGLPTQSVAEVATGRHINAALAGQVGVWLEDSDLVTQHINGVDYEDAKLIVAASVSCLDVSKVDQVRAVWADSIKAVVKQRFRVSSDAVFFALRRMEVLDDQSSDRTPAGIRGALGALGILRQPPGIDQVRVRITLGQRVISSVDVV